MFGISAEHLVILAIILLLFGPRRLPELGNTLGKAIKNFKDAVSGIEEAKYRHVEEKSNPQKIAESKTVAVAQNSQASTNMAAQTRAGETLAERAPITPATDYKSAPAPEKTI